MLRGVAQMVARLVRDQEARSSNLRTPTKRTARVIDPCRSFDFVMLDPGPLDEPSAAWFGKSGLPPPGADAGRTLFPQRSKNARKGESPPRFSVTARRREAKRPGVQISALRPRRRKLHIACDDFLCFASKVISRSFRCSSFQNRTRFAYAPILFLFVNRVLVSYTPEGHRSLPFFCFCDAGSRENAFSARDFASGEREQ